MKGQYQNCQGTETAMQNSNRMAKRRVGLLLLGIRRLSNRWYWEITNTPSAFTELVSDTLSISDKGSAFNREEQNGDFLTNLIFLNQAGLRNIIQS